MFFLKKKKKFRYKIDSLALKGSVILASYINGWFVLSNYISFFPY